MHQADKNKNKNKNKGMRLVQWDHIFELPEDRAGEAVEEVI
jgi:hypothetical protein